MSGVLQGFVLFMASPNFWLIISFLVVVVCFIIFAWKHILKLLDQKTEDIRKNMQDAEEDLEQLVGAYDQSQRDYEKARHRMERVEEEVKEELLKVKEQYALSLESFQVHVDSWKDQRKRQTVDDMRRKLELDVLGIAFADVKSGLSKDLVGKSVDAFAEKIGKRNSDYPIQS